MTAQTQAGAGESQTGTDINKGKDEGVLTEEALVKSLQTLESVVAASPEGRKNALLSKALNGPLTNEETTELTQILSGKLSKGLGATVGETLTVGDDLQKSFDATPFIDHLNADLTKAMALIAESVEKSDTARQNEVVVLAKGLLDLGKLLQANNALVKSLAAGQQQVAEVLGVIRRQPVAAPRSGNVTSQVGTAVASPAATTLTKSDVSEILHQMLVTSPDGLVKGFDVAVEAAQYEQFNQFSSPQFEAEVIAFAKKQRAASGAR